MGGEFDEFKWIALSDIHRHEREAIVKDRERTAIVYDGIIIWGMTRRILLRVYDETDELKKQIFNA